MTLHLFRPAELGKTPSPPVGAPRRVKRAVAVPQLLAQLRDLCHQPHVARIVQICLLLVGLVVQGVLLLTVAYLTDLCVSLMELWADLARKHLEITM